MRKYAYILLMCGAVVLASASTSTTTIKTSNAATLQVTQPDSLDLYVEQLAFAESSGKEDVVVVDTNGRLSKGCLQFQDDTFSRYSARFKTSGQIMDCAAQKELAKLILTHDKNGWKNWYRSVKRLGMPPVSRNG